MNHLTITRIVDRFVFQYESDLGNQSRNTEFPAELLPHVQALVDYVDGIKTPKELFFEKIVSQATDEEKLDMIDLYPLFVFNHAYAIGDEFRFGDDLFKVIQAHTSQSDWLPPAVPALYLKIAPAGTVPEWVQPTGAHDAYASGAHVIFEGQEYMSLINANVWSPTTYPAGWQLVP